MGSGSGCLRIREEGLGLNRINRRKGVRIRRRERSKIGREDGIEGKRMERGKWVWVRRELN